MTEETIFHEAQAKPAAERAAYLDQACAGDAALRERVEALLRAHDDPGSFLAGSPVDRLAATVGQPARPPGAVPAVRAIAEGTGSRIGPYRLLEPIGEG